jgi:adenylate cyclase
MICSASPTPTCQIDPDARRRRLTALINTASLTRTAPALYVIEDAHWIDEVSESMLADFLTVIPQTKLMVLITSRPEYEGALMRAQGAQTIALAPLGDSDTAALLGELLGSDPSAGGLAVIIADRAAGNPFFAEEIVRDLAERAAIRGTRGSYVLHGDIADVSVPATVQAAIAARVDRLSPSAKRTLSAAAVIGSRFSPDLVTALGIEPSLDGLVKAELVDQVGFTSRVEYAFRHPLIRAAAYESQLKSDRARLHRRLAAAIEARDPGSADENAALIATHFEAAGDLHAAYSWHMRAGGWSNYRDIRAARMSWQQARQVGDRLPSDDPNRAAMRIAPRALLCGSGFRVGENIEDAFVELHELATAAGDSLPLAIGMVGLMGTRSFSSRHQEASRLASEFTTLVESIGDPIMTAGLLYGAAYPKWEAGEMDETLRLAQRVIDLADGDPVKGNLIWGSPLAYALTMRGIARLSLGRPGWLDDFDESVAIARKVDPLSRVVAELYRYGLCILYGALLSDEDAVRHTGDSLRIAERFGDDFTLAIARANRAFTLTHCSRPERSLANDLLTQARDNVVVQHMPGALRRFIDIESAREQAQSGDLDGAVAAVRTIVDEQFDTDEMVTRGPGTALLVESLLRRSAKGDLEEAQAVIDRLAAVPTDSGFVLHEITLLRLRTLQARAHGDEAAYRDYRDHYRGMATSLGFEGHIAMAEAMT